MSLKRRKTLSAPPRDPYLVEFYNPRTQKLAIYNIRENRTFKQLQTLLPRLGSLSLNYTLREAILGVMTIEDWSELKQNHFLPPAQSWIRQLGWLAYGLIQGAEQIRSYLPERRNFGKNYLLGNISAAQASLEIIRRKFGVSLWLAEREFLLLQISRGFDAHKAALSHIQQSVKDSLFRYFITATSSRLEPHISYEAYQKNITETLRNIREQNDPDLASIVEFHISHWSFEWTSNLATILSFISGEPLIDRYNQTVKALASICASELPPNERLEVVEILKALHSATGDSQLHNALLLISPQSRKHSEKTDRYLSALDHLVTGHHSDCIESTFNLLQDEPTCLQYYWLLARACACQQQHWKELLPTDAIASKILEALFEVAENRTALNLPLSTLKTIALKLGDNHLGIALWQFVEYEESHDHSRVASAQIITRNKIDLFDIINCGDALYTERSISAVSQIYAGHISVSLILLEQPQYLIREEDRIRIEPTLLAIAMAKRFLAEGHYKEALDSISPILDPNQPATNVQSVHLVNIAPIEFEAFIQNGLIIDAARATVRAYLRSPNSLRHVPFEALIDGGNSGRWPELKKTAYWPILFLLNNADEQSIYEAVDDYLFANGCKSPIEIIERKIPISDLELRILCRDVLVLPVLARAALWGARTAEDRRKLRTRALRKIYELFPEDETFAIAELSRIEQARALQSAYLKVEGPKFHLNFDEINRALAPLLESTFERYLEYKRFEKTGGPLLSEDHLLKLATNKTEGNQQHAITQSHSIVSAMAIDVFTQYILDPVRGVNSALGTRVRHGSLENQIGRVFGAKGILAVRSIGGTFRCSQALEEKLAQIDQNIADAVRRSYIAFTQSLISLQDDLITRRFRIRLPNDVLYVIKNIGSNSTDFAHEDGLLDYSSLFTLTMFARLASKDYDGIGAFLVEAAETFTSRTFAAFERVRTFVSNALVKEVNRLLADLDQSLEVTLPDGQLRAELREGVQSAKNEFVQDIEIIRNWFGSATPSTSTTTLGEIFDISFKVLNFANNGRLGHAPARANAELAIKPDVSQNFYDVIAILLRNIVEHSGMTSGQCITFSYAPSGKAHSFSIVNRVLTSELCAENCAKAKAALAQPYDHWALGKAPGGTGLSRIRTLLRQSGWGNTTINVSELTDPIRFEVEIVLDR